MRPCGTCRWDMVLHTCRGSQCFLSKSTSGNIAGCLTPILWDNCPHWVPLTGKCQSWLQSLSETRAVKLKGPNCHPKEGKLYFLLPQLILFAASRKTPWWSYKPEFPIYWAEVILPSVYSLVLSPAWCSSHGRVGRCHSLMALMFSGEGGHAGTRSPTSQHHTWRTTTSYLAEGKDAPIATSFSSHHDGEDQNWVAQGTAEVPPFPTVLPSRSLSDEYVHSRQASPMCCPATARCADPSPHVVEVQSHLYPTTGVLELY